MIRRCCDPRHKAYSNYGGRGITVCDRWRFSVKDFVADMGPRPSKDHSIDRLDNNRGYEPGNCVWETRSKQSRNSRSNVWLTARGKTMVISDWSKETGVPHDTLAYRIRHGWPAERALVPAGR
jgi:hypothetical protein